MHAATYRAAARVAATIVSAAALILASAASASAASVGSAPYGPPTPSGGWSVAYGDAFNVPLGSGSGYDNTLFPNGAYHAVFSCSQYAMPANASSEMQVYACGHANVDSYGLHLTCTYTPGVYTYSGYKMNYTCGQANGTMMQNSSGVYVSPAGYRFFNFRPYEGQTWAIEIKAQFPPNTGEADPGWWSSDEHWTEETDWFEGFGSAAGSGGTWCKSNPLGRYIGTTDPTVIYKTGVAHVAGDSYLCRDFGWDPSAAVHTYTTLIRGSSVSEYIDGKLVKWSYGTSGVPGTTSFSVPSTSGAYVGAILTYALRTNATGNPSPWFQSGTRDFHVRSIAVYENATANFANTKNHELAPGTTLAP